MPVRWICDSCQATAATEQYRKRIERAMLKERELAGAVDVDMKSLGAEDMKTPPPKAKKSKKEKEKEKEKAKNNKVKAADSDDDTPLKIVAVQKRKQTEADLMAAEEDQKRKHRMIALCLRSDRLLFTQLSVNARSCL